MFNAGRMEVTGEVWEYAETLTDNEKATLYPVMPEKGMDEMSETFKELGGEIYLFEDGAVREPIY